MKTFAAVTVLLLSAGCVYYPDTYADYYSYPYAGYSYYYPYSGYYAPYRSWYGYPSLSLGYSYSTHYRHGHYGYYGSYPRYRSHWYGNHGSYPSHRYFNPGHSGKGYSGAWRGHGKGGHR